MSASASRRTPEADRSAPVVISGVWKGENESDPELVESYSTNPLTTAGAWTEEEACALYREKLVRLKDLYMGQLSHLRHCLRERKRQSVLEWQGEGGEREQVNLPSEGGSREDTAYRCYRKRSGEEALLERRQKQRRVATSLDLYSRQDTGNKAHYHHLARLHQQVGSPVPTVCAIQGCDNHCMPFSGRCARHICEDPRQQLYTRCSYGGGKCTNPIPQYCDPPLCGGHCDTMEIDMEARQDDFIGGRQDGGEGGGGGGGEGGEEGGRGGGEREGRELSVKREKSLESDVLSLSCDEAVTSETLQRRHP